MDNFSLTKYVCRRKICLCKFNSVTKFHCQISATKMSELSNISNTPIPLGGVSKYGHKIP